MPVDISNKLASGKTREDNIAMIWVARTIGVALDGVNAAKKSNSESGLSTSPVVLKPGETTLNIMRRNKVDWNKKIINPKLNKSGSVIGL